MCVTRRRTCRRASRKEEYGRQPSTNRCDSSRSTVVARPRYALVPLTAEGTQRRPGFPSGAHRCRVAVDRQTPRSVGPHGALRERAGPARGVVQSDPVNTPHRVHPCQRSRLRHLKPAEARVSGACQMMRRLSAARSVSAQPARKFHTLTLWVAARWRPRIELAVVDLGERAATVAVNVSASPSSACTSRMRRARRRQ